MKTIQITDSSFEQEVRQSRDLTIVDFWAPWCGPCRLVAPVLEEIAYEYDGQLKITKLNVDDNLETTKSFGIAGIPTLLFFKDGEVVDRVVGAVSKKELEGRIRSLLLRELNVNKN